LRYLNADPDILQNLAADVLLDSNLKISKEGYSVIAELTHYMRALCAERAAFRAWAHKINNSLSPSCKHYFCTNSCLYVCILLCTTGSNNTNVAHPVLASEEIHCRFEMLTLTDLIGSCVGDVIMVI
jgi:hypothetical protein